MNKFLNMEIQNSNSIFEYLFHNKIPAHAFLEDVTQLKGALIGWDDNFLLLLDGEKIQLISLKRLLRLEADTVKIIEKNVPKPELVKPKISAVINEIEAPAQAEKEKSADGQNKQFKDRLDQLVRNW